MLNVNQRLRELEEQGRPIRVGVVGAGQMGSALIAQLQAIRGMRVAAVADVIMARARSALVAAGVSPDAVVVTAGGQDLGPGRVACTESATALVSVPDVDVVVEATGVPEVGAEVASAAIAAGKHIVMLNVEADVTVGPLLARRARTAGVIYTGSAGDEPACTKELHDFADALGWEVLVAGKGKNNPLRPHATPDELAAEAAARNMGVKMLTSFVDGTKTMVEMTCLANAIGFTIDRPGMHGVEADTHTVVDRLRLVSEGGVLGSYGVVEYVNGLAPGVFIIFRSGQPVVDQLLGYVRLGRGPNYLLYRPYHLTSLETPLSVARAVIYGEPTIVPMGAPVAETVAMAKRDLAPGEELDGLGGATVYGSIDTAEAARRAGALPLGLAVKGTRMRRRVPRDHLLTYDDVAMPELLIHHLRRAQDAMFGP